MKSSKENLEIAEEFVSILSAKEKRACDEDGFHIYKRVERTKCNYYLKNKGLNDFFIKLATV